MTPDHRELQRRIEALEATIAQIPGRPRSRENPQRWLYTEGAQTRYVQWILDGDETDGWTYRLADAELGSAPDLNSSITYVPGATPADRELYLGPMVDISGLLLFQGGSAPTAGQIVTADADGKPIWDDPQASSGQYVTRIVLTSASSSTWSIPSTASKLLVACIGAGGGASALRNFIKGYMALTSGGTPDVAVRAVRGGAGSGGDAALRTYYRPSSGWPATATISVGAGGTATSGTTPGNRGGDTSITISGLQTTLARGGAGGNVEGRMPTITSSPANAGDVVLSGHRGAHGRDFYADFGGDNGFELLGGRSPIETHVSGLNYGRGGICRETNENGKDGAIIIWHD